MAKSHWVQPNLDVNMFMSKNYIMVHLDPLPHSGMLRPQRYHITVSRARWSQQVRDCDATAELGSRLQMVFDSLQFGNFCESTRAPWHNSWNFGLGKSWTIKLQILRDAGDVIMRDIDPVVRILEHWEFHTSWN